MRSLLTVAALTAAVVTLACWAAPQPVSAAPIPCKIAGAASGVVGKACDLLSNPKQLLGLGKNLLTGHLSSVLNTLLGDGTASASTALSLAAIGAWIMGGAKAAVTWMVKAIQTSAAPQLGAVWFSSTYWRVAGISALLTLPFLFAAAVQALVRSDLSVLTRAAFGYLPLAMLCVAIAAPLTMLLLSATDELCSFVWTPSSSHGLTTLMTKSGGLVGIAALVHSRFLGFLFGVFTASGAVLVWLELLMREAAVYIVVLLLPLAFAALVWPARRVWALRSAELLVALILSKFAVVAVLGLGGMALDHGGSHGVGAVVAGVVLVILAAFAPWAVLRLIPLSEIASGAASSLRSHTEAPFKFAWGTSKETERSADAVASHLAAQLALATGSGNGSSPLANKPPTSKSTPSAADQGFEEWPDAFADGANDGQPVDEENAAGQPGGAAPGRTNAPETNSGVTTTAATDERVPGAAPMWQAPDMSWRPLTLGNDQGWPPPPLWTEEDGATGGAPAGNDAAPHKLPDEPVVDQADPLPPSQDPGGAL